MGDVVGIPESQDEIGVRCATSVLGCEVACLDKYMLAWQRLLFPIEHAYP
jgi:hypothetical protein